MLFLREIQESDIDLLYQWANDPTVRENSFNSDLISYQTHVEWFHQMIGNASVLQFILMEDEEPIGQIRLTIESDVAEIGYSIASNHRGKGYGHKILQLTVKEVGNNHPEIKRLIAKVKSENEASNRLFRTEGYEMDYTQYSYVIRH